MAISLFQSFYTDEDTNLMKKFKLYVEDNWNKCDMVTIFLFIIGVTCRYIFAPHGWQASSTKGYLYQLTLMCMTGQALTFIFTSFETCFCP